jgi:phenylpropionate dioxygenase-like ring-hydroxylating dioxygenase large terminal subunit
MYDGMDIAGAEPDLETLVKGTLACAGQTIQKANTLPPATYVSQSFFNLELEKIFRQDWLCVGHLSQVASEGDYFTIDLFGELLVVVRGKDRIRVMSRVCLHRWAPLVNGSGNTRVLSCPFHKWGYGLDGQLLGAPLMENVDFDIAGCRLPQFATEVVDGFIYMSFAENPPPLAPQLTKLSAHLAKFRLDELIVAHVIEYELKFNWKIIVETFMECYHHIAAHVDTFEVGFPARLSYITDGEDAWTMGHSPARAGVSAEEIAAGFPLLAEQNTDAELHEFRLYCVYPDHILALMPDRAFWFRMQPEAPNRTKLQTYLLVRPEALSRPDYAEKLSTEVGFFEKFNGQDIAVNEMQQLGAATATATVGQFCVLEKACWQLADYIRKRLGA